MHLTILARVDSHASLFPSPHACSWIVAGAAKSTKMKVIPPLVQEALDQGFKVKVGDGQGKNDCIYFLLTTFSPL
jgi:hypothetical protein